MSATGRLVGGGCDAPSSKLWAPRSRARTAFVCAMAALTLIAATGIVDAKAFALPTTLKYGLTVAGPLLLFVGATIERPIRLVGALVVIASPLASATASAGPTRVSVLVPLLLIGIALTIASGPSHGRPPALRWTGLLAIPLLAIPMINGSSRHSFLVALLTLVVVAWVVAAAASEPGGLVLIFASVAVQAALQAAIAIWEATSGQSLNLYSAAGSSSYGAGYAYAFHGLTRPNGSFNDPIGLANALAIALPLIVALVFIVRRPLLRSLTLIAVGASGVGLVFALDRTAWIATVLGAAVFVVALPTAVRRRAAAWIAGGLIIAIIGAAAFGGAALTSKFSTIFHPTSATGQTVQERGIAEGELDRLLYWKIAWRDGFLDHPILGIGIGNMSTLIASHSNSIEAGSKSAGGSFLNAASTYLELVGEAGAFAVALLLALLVSLGIDLVAVRRTRPVMAAGLMAAVVALLVCWVTDIVVTSPPVAACVGVLFGAVAGAARGQALGDRSSDLAVASTGVER